MDYIFENLGHERFQELCSLIIANEFPNTQSLPVGQPDGGRDAIVYIMNTQKKGFIVFQVKYVRNPNQINDVHKWFVDIINEEVPKINKLIPDGAVSYYLLTNVKGTAHYEKGSIDKLNSVLETKIKIPSMCWWKDDLSRLVEKNPLIKWSYPEILSGQDLLNSLVFKQLEENRENRENVIKAYLADQYSLDNEVKFRQIDLQNKLLELFTDVPLRIKKINEKNKSLKKVLGFFDSYCKKIVNLDETFLIEEVENIGAASFLLHSKTQNELQRILLEGGPGQGKSTISQYICQVHRVRLLNKMNDIKQLPSEIASTPIRLPFKIDLRHVAAWVENRNPYQGRINDAFYEKVWKNSLESFLIGHIIYHSQLDNFSSIDLISIIKVTPILLVFDGFDEIANFQIRQEVIDFINKGINRLSENAMSIQVVITSRPAAFSDSTVFSVDMYPHFELTDITPSITKEYVEKWIKASKLDNREANEIRRLVDEKLQMPHLKDLARSPMQLAIFISLLRTRGESLPNKRTALYDSYIELFFNRESEKSSIIRDHRYLIIDIHQYLAWLLHSEAELLKNTGSINIDELKSKLKVYLTKEGHKTDIADQLFHVMKERVCALVSRTQGTYEFEVQPLREYFCAKYLYNTSPYSPVGSEKPGTKPERFDAIARNFYWQNVVRFFAGCFDKGELPMLIQKLNEIQNDEILKYTNFPRIITSQILSDWVFTQYPILLKDVVRIIVDGINIGNILNQESGFLSNEPIVVPAECGREEIVNECFEQLKKFPHNDYASELLGIIKNNPINVQERWSAFVPDVSGQNLTLWLEYAYKLELIHKIEDKTLIEIVKKDDIENRFKKIQILINGNRFGIINNDYELKETTLEGILKSKIFFQFRRQQPSGLIYLSTLINPFILSSVFHNEENNITLSHYIIQRYSFSTLDSHQIQILDDFQVEDNIDIQIKRIKDKTIDSINRKVFEWRNSIDPWDEIVEAIRNEYNDCISLKIIAIIAAGIKTKESLSEEYNDLNNNSISLCKRVRFARMKSGNINFWTNQIHNSEDLVFTFLVFFTWATPKTIFQLYDVIVEHLNKLSNSEYYEIADGLLKSIKQSYFYKTQKEETANYIDKLELNDDFLLLVLLRFEEEERNKYIFEKISNYEIRDRNIGHRALYYLIDNFLQTPSNEELLVHIVNIYSSIKTFEEKSYYYRRLYRNSNIDIPIEIAKKIMLESKKYPRIIASFAEKSCRLYANKNQTPVGLIANNFNWFEYN